MTRRGFLGARADNLIKTKPGERPPAARLNVLQDAAARARVIVGPNSGLAAQALPDGLSLRVVKEFVAIFVLNAKLNAASSMPTYTTAIATIQVDTGTQLVSGASGFTIKNYHDVSFASGATICAALIRGSWWVIDPSSCTSVGT